MNKALIAFLAMTTCIPLYEATACSCVSTAENIFDSISMEISGRRNENPVTSPEFAVVLGKVDRYLQLREGPVATEMVVDVEYVLHGDVTSRKIIVEGDNGIQCRPYVTNFPMGRTYVFAIERSGEGQNYAISICGHYSLAVKRPESQ